MTNRSAPAPHIVTHARTGFTQPAGRLASLGFSALAFIGMLLMGRRQ